MTLDFTSFLHPALYRAPSKSSSSERDLAHATRFYDQNLAVLGAKVVKPLNASDLKDSKIWTSFESSLRSVLSEEAIQATCDRFNINFARLRASRAVLDPMKHILPFVMRAIDPIGKEAEAKLAGASHEEMDQSEAVIQNIGIKLLLEFLSDDTLNDLKKSNYKLFCDIQRLYYTSDTQNLRKKQFMEILAKKIASCSLDEGMIISSPLKEGGIGYYKVHKKIAINGLVAFALKPLEGYPSLTPIVLFRPTQTSSQAELHATTLANDLERVVGTLGYTAARNQLAELMNDESFLPDGKKINLVGFSLGGAHAQHLLADFPGKVARAYFFNDPSLDEETNNRFLANLRAIPEQERSIKIRVYRTEGDFVHAAGRVHVGFTSGEPISGLNVKVFNLTPDESEGINVAQIKRDKNLIRHAGARKRLHTALVLQNVVKHARFGEILKISNPIASKISSLEGARKLEESGTVESLHFDFRDLDVRNWEILRQRFMGFLLLLQMLVLFCHNLYTGVSVLGPNLRRPLARA